MITTLWAVGLPVLALGFVLGWAARRSEDGACLERRARWLAGQMAAHGLPPAPPAWADVVEAEVVSVEATRLDRPELTR